MNSALSNGRCRNHGGRRKQGDRIAKVLSTRSRSSMLTSGEISVQDLDWEELKRGCVRNSRGDFTGHKAELIPRKLYNKLVEEIIRRSEDTMREDLDVALSTLKDLMTNPRTPAREKLAATQYWIERVIGKVPERQNIQLEVTKFEELVGSGALFVDLPGEDIVDGETV